MSAHHASRGSNASSVDGYNVVPTNSAPSALQASASEQSPLLAQLSGYVPANSDYEQPSKGHLATTVEKLRAFKDHNLGLLLVMASELFFALMNLTVKFLNRIDPPVPALELILIRMLITYTCCVTYLYAKGDPHPFLGPKGIRLLLTLRGFGGFVGMLGLYLSLQYLTLSTAITLSFLAPFTTSIVATFVLKEKPARGDLVAGFISMLGVLLIARPPILFGDTPPDEEGVTPAQRMAGVGVSMIGVLGATCAYISIRAVGKRASWMHTTSYFALQSIVFSPPLSLATGVRYVLPTNTTFLLLLPAIGIFGFTAQALLTLGLQRETAGRGTLGLYIQLVFAVFLEWLVFGVLPKGLTVVGMSIIVACALYVALSKMKGAPKPPPSTQQDSNA